MIVRYAKVACDKCGREHGFDPKREDPFSSSFTQEEEGLRGWGAVKGKHLCPDCHGAYRRLKAEAEAALDERFGLAGA